MLPEGATRGSAPLRPRRSGRLASWRMTPRQACDLELIASGAFAPLRSFLGQADYDSVCERMRLVDGSLWPVPITLDITGAALRAATRSGRLLLCDTRDRVIAVLTVTEAWRPDLMAEAESVLGTTDHAHPWVAHLRSATNPWCVTGPLVLLRELQHPDLPPLVRTPAAVRAEIERRGWQQVVAFNTRNPMHAAHQALVLRALADGSSAVLVHPVVGPTRPGDVSAAVRARCYQAVMRSLPPERSMLALLPLAMRMAGPREALWHALVRRNYGATHFVVGRDHAGPGKNSRGHPFYPEYGAQELVRAHEAELRIRPLCLPELVYVDGLGYLPRDEVPSGRVAMAVSGTHLRALLAEGAEVPRWLAAPEVVAELAAEFAGVAGDRSLTSGGV
jgi:sulfate adenylyltransferase